MELMYIYDGYMRSVDSILEFTTDDKLPFWRNSIFLFHPDIDKEKYNTMSNEMRKEYLIEYLCQYEKAHLAEINEKLILYNEYWKANKRQVIEAFQDAFDLDLVKLFNDMKCYLTFNAISPRYLQNNSFDVFYLNSHKGALGNALHEITHFVWFYVWKNHFHDNESHYETPHLKWILSEMVVDSIMRDNRLSLINPYFEEGCAYQYFYTMKINGVPILEKLYTMYKSYDIKKFMVESYNFCVKYESEIRKHIEFSESES